MSFFQDLWWFLQDFTLKTPREAGDWAILGGSLACLVIPLFFPSLTPLWVWGGFALYQAFFSPYERRLRKETEQAGIAAIKELHTWWEKHELELVHSVEEELDAVEQTFDAVEQTLDAVKQTFKDRSDEVIARLADLNLKARALNVLDASLSSNKTPRWPSRPADFNRWVFLWETEIEQYAKRGWPSSLIHRHLTQKRKIAISYETVNDIVAAGRAGVLRQLQFSETFRNGG